MFLFRMVRAWYLGINVCEHYLLLRKFMKKRTLFDNLLQFYCSGVVETIKKNDCYLATFLYHLLNCKHPEWVNDNDANIKSVVHVCNAIKDKPSPSVQFINTGTHMFFVYNLIEERFLQCLVRSNSKRIWLIDRLRCSISSRRDGIHQNILRRIQHDVKKAVSRKYLIRKEVVHMFRS